MREILVVSLLAAAAPPTHASAPPGAAESQGAPQPHFSVNEYRVLGNTVLEPRDIERVLYPLLGPGKTLTDVEGARAALEKSYHDRGYGTVFVDIPPQDVGPDGIVRLRATEGRVHERTISGARYFSERDLLKQLPAAAPGEVPRIPELQKELAAVNAQSADRTVAPVLKAGPVPGTVDLGLKVDDHLPLHASVELSNQNTPDTDPLRATTAVSYDNLFGDLDSISALYQTAPQEPEKIGVLEAAYTMHPLGGIQPSLSYVHSSSNVATLGTLGVLGKGDIYSVRTLFPLPVDGGQQSLLLDVDYKHFRNTISLTGSTGLITPISYVNASLGYSGSWRPGPDLVLVNVAANFGPRGLANNNPDDFANDRYLARANYFYLRSDLTYERELPGRFRLRLRAAGQYAFEPLISNEDYSIAGADGVRGYLEVEELGDRALKGTVQLEAPPLRWHDLDAATLFGFYDAGHAYSIDALSGQPFNADLRSTGAGVNFAPLRGVSGYLTWARALTAGSRTSAGESRWLFDLKGSF